MQMGRFVRVNTARRSVNPEMDDTGVWTPFALDFRAVHANRKLGAIKLTGTPYLANRDARTGVTRSNLSF